jgi:hypothetical protein
MDGHQDRWLTFLLGCVGALAPEIVRLYDLRRKPPKEVFLWWYYIASVPYALLGGVVSLVLPATTTWAAFYAGVTTPMLVSRILKHGKRSETRNMVNERDNIIRASDPTQKPFYKTKRRVRAFVEFVRNHADGLFE